MDDCGGTLTVDATLAQARSLAVRREARWRRRPLSPGLSLLLWAMRLYVVLMLVVVAVQLLRLA